MPKEDNNIDEQMIPFTVRIFLCTKMPNKPDKWGFKIFSTNGNNGQVFDFDIKGAPNPTEPSDFKGNGQFIFWCNP